IFFFQAEDGIRDDLVTGVQTCALPIFGTHQRATIRGKPHYRKETSLSNPTQQGSISGSLIMTSPFNCPPVFQLVSQHATLFLWRSEERRVGKECRSGGCENWWK